MKNQNSITLYVNERMRKIISYLIVASIFQVSYAQYIGQNEDVQIKKDEEPEILYIKWMDKDMTEELSYFAKGDTLSLLVYTKNYQQGDTISITVKKDDDTDLVEGGNEFLFKGIVDDDGYVRIKAAIKTEDIQ